MEINKKTGRMEGLQDSRTQLDVVTYGKREKKSHQEKQEAS